MITTKKYDRHSAIELMPLLRSIAFEIEERTGTIGHIEERVSALGTTRTAHADELRRRNAELAEARRELRHVLEELEDLGCLLEPDQPLTIRVPGVDGDYAYRWHAGTGSLQPLEAERAA